MILVGDFVYRREVPEDLSGILHRLEPALKTRGFGILANLDVARQLREKLGTSQEDLVILDVCSPRHAHRILAVHPEAAWLLPCKIVLSHHEGRTRIDLPRPTELIGVLNPPSGLRGIAWEVEQLLMEAVDEAAGGPTLPTHVPSPSAVTG